MDSSKRLSLLAAAFILAVASSAPTFALEDSELNNISQNCATIKQSLTKLQRADSRTRAYLGSSYEAIANNFITPLNIRLLKNNRTDPTIFEIQSEFTDTHARFRSDKPTQKRL